MTKDKLVQYCDLKVEIENLEKRIDRIRKQSEMVADVVQNGYKGRAVIRGVDIIRKQKLDKLNNILNERYDKLLQTQIEIEEFISSIENSKLRQIFEFRYIDNFSWIQIQTILKFKHEDTARKKHDRYIEKLKEN